MIALCTGIVLIAFTVFAALPAGLRWGEDILLFIRGALPVLTAFVGLVAVFIGVADIKDKNEAKKEEAAAEEIKKEGE